MSRIGKSPIPVPSGVSVNIDGTRLAVSGPKGTLEHDLPDGISVAVDDGRIQVSRSDDERQSRALHGLTRSLVNNMVIGVTEGFQKRLEIVGVGYRANAKSATELELQLGYSHPVSVTAPDGVTFEVPVPTQIGVIGIDKQAVGQVAADIRSLRKPEPYKGKGIRYQGERIIRKAGKARK
ncbi:MAG: 50S ribosomal protein L6 [Acidimicrobiales bacterium]|nr:50S ribosomal protein L6 [Acidimicrobiales bacterium]